ncbi:putative hydrolase or acyltransferase (alpha/beta hydrolase superfamily) [Rubidibacter lacunae KORDI 51-2]|uniref:Putative hydrolase or acyltransferase (Alpha/beta hydrolase superfamily) n=1 Tax=Rubidibacter lacunae KORDI 51-2 TaxID=582515 RepID=U5DIF0_9CHRO|nr:alpha/beta fold hydrolase [Rubidibacter lacunae]ERN41446.1 putative hydrolase or acyltransferase (alpha/beta hydrolase superfamily) [Rubidibacter lacunae KORDI 51-2]
MTASLTPHHPARAIASHEWTWQGERIAYFDAGSGRPLVLIHGFGASSGHWRKNVPALTAAGYRVLAIDLLGFGASEKPDRADYSVELWEQLLVDFWRDCVGEPAVFVGNSIGGLLSLAVCAHHPELAAGCVLINSAGGLNHRPEELVWPLGAILASFARLAGAPIVGPLLFNRVSQRGQIRRTLRQVYCDAAAVTDELVDLIHQPARDRGAQKVFARVLNAPPGPRPSELLPHVCCPLLVLWGEKDPWTPISGATVYQDLSRDREDVEFYAIGEAGHCAHDEKPEAVNDRLCTWVRSAVWTQSSATI